MIRLTKTYADIYSDSKEIDSYFVESSDYSPWKSMVDDRMKIIKGISIFTTIISVILVFIFALFATIFYLFLNDIGKFNSDILGTTLDDMKALLGFNIYLDKGILGIMDDLALVVMFLICIILAVYFLIPSVFGIVVNANSKKNSADIMEYTKSYKADAMVKILIYGLPLARLIWEDIFYPDNEADSTFLIALIIFTVLSVFQYVKAKQIIH